jgi:hypothetical protein
MNDYQLSTEPALDSSFFFSTLPADEHQPEAKPLEHIEEVQEASLEQIHIVGSLLNTLTWGEEKIVEPVDEVLDIQEIAYN